MNYFIETTNLTYIYVDDRKYTYDKYIKLINYLEKLYLRDLKSYKKNLRDILNIKSKVPYYLSSNLVLFRVKQEENIYYINYSNILCITNILVDVLIIFKGGCSLLLKNANNEVNQQIKKINLIKNHFNSLKDALHLKLIIE